MKKYMLITVIAGLSILSGCHDVKVGYLQTGNAVYVPDSLIVRLTLDENLDGFRIHNVAPWVTPKMQGIIGTTPLFFEVESVRASQGANPEMFRHLLNIRGGGRMEFPLISDIPKGRYLVSVRVYNEGYNQVVKDAFTFVVK